MFHQNTLRNGVKKFEKRYGSAFVTHLAVTCDTALPRSQQGLPTPTTLAPPDPNAINATASQSSIMAPTATKRPGFASFASTSSLFAAVAQAKSPILGSLLISSKVQLAEQDGNE